MVERPRNAVVYLKLEGADEGGETVGTSHLRPSMFVWDSTAGWEARSFGCNGLKFETMKAVVKPLMIIKSKRHDRITIDKSKDAFYQKSQGSLSKFTSGKERKMSNSDLVTQYQFGPEIGGR